MDRSDDRTAELRRAPQALTERIPQPRSQADQRARGPYPYLAPRQPRFTPRIQHAPQPTFTPAPTQPVSRPAPPQPASSPPAPPRQSPKRYERRPARAIIGDELRIPILWCQFGRCVAYHTDVDALGERDLRFRALAAGWRYDLLGRLACPSCVQRDPTFWITRPPALMRRS